MGDEYSMSPETMAADGRNKFSNGSPESVPALVEVASDMAKQGRELNDFVLY